MPVDDSCPVCRTADIVCGKWTLLLVRELAEGRSRFCELERCLQGISPRTLSLRLRALEEEGIVERQTFPEVPPRRAGRRRRGLIPRIAVQRAATRATVAGLDRHAGTRSRARGPRGDHP